MDAKPLAKAMEAEAQLLNDYAARLNSLQQTIGQRNWEDVEKGIAGLRDLAGGIETAEAARVEAYRILKSDLFLPADAAFDRVADSLAAGARDELRGLHRRLRIAIVRVKGSSGLLGYYVRSALDARRQVLEELYPHRKGRLYSRSGRARAAADESLMLDRRY